MSPNLDEVDDTDTELNGHFTPLTDAMNGEDAPGMSSFIERHYNVGKREAPPIRKRKSPELDDDDEDEARKKAKVSSQHAGGSGVLGEYLKSERDKGAAESGPSNEAIDLTNDDEDDIIFLGQTSSGNENQEVCLGRLHAKANAFRIPTPPKHQHGVLGGDFWPQMKVRYFRNTSQNYIMELFDRPNPGQGIKFGTVEIKTAGALCPLLDGNHVNKLKLKMFVEPNEKRNGEYPGARVSRTLNLSIMLYAPRKFGDAIGRQLSQKGLFLSAPLNPGRGVEYYNPRTSTDR